jgi:hypothetical protein
VRVASPLMSGEARDLDETLRAQNRLRGREAMVDAITAQILIGGCATANGQTRGDVVQRPCVSVILTQLVTFDDLPTRTAWAVLSRSCCGQPDIGGSMGWSRHRCRRCREVHRAARGSSLPRELQRPVVLRVSTALVLRALLAKTQPDDAA